VFTTTRTRSPVTRRVRGAEKFSSRSAFAFTGMGLAEVAPFASAGKSASGNAANAARAARKNRPQGPKPLGTDDGRALGTAQHYFGQRHRVSAPSESPTRGRYAL
jgi:hypothetical protein